jgi:2-keto-4-pentenoate hydratase/2-oxohepta-3-ene-1,7-dioic acid hydratase in catechol pathway
MRYDQRRAFSMGYTQATRYQLGTALLSGRERMVLSSNDRLFDLSTLLDQQPFRDSFALEGRKFPHSLLALIESWSYWKDQLPGLVAAQQEQQRTGTPFSHLEQEQITWLPPLLYPRKLICIGTNYQDHVAEMGVAKLPRYPYSFLKPPTTTLIGSGQPLRLPEQARLVDWEAELAVVIGQRAHKVRGAEAMACIAGYSIFNDISARDWIAEAPSVGIDWVMQKAFDGFAPMGPFLTPATFVPDPQRLSIRLTVNGELKQDSTTANMIFSVQEIIEHLASMMTLEPGDVIATGTPAGVGFGKKPPEVLHPGDIMSVEIEDLGRLETPVVS